MGGAMPLYPAGSLLLTLLLCCAPSLVDGQLADPATTRSLFAGDAAVVDLSGTDFAAVHRSAPLCPWLVLFYSDGCGHCREAASAYNTFAAQLDDCHEEDPLRMVTAAAVNCGTELQTCRSHRVYSVPMFFLFFTSYCTAGVNKPCDAKNMRHVVLDPRWRRVSELQQETRRWVKQMMRAEGALVERCVNMRHSLYAEKNVRVKRETGNMAPFVETRKLHPTDIAGAFFLTMWHEVSIVGFESPAHLLALKDFLYLVDHSLSGLGAGTLLEAVVSMHDDEEGFSVARWQKAVVAARIPYEGNPREVQWHTCKGSSPKYRGFPCGMWLLYHSLTVNADAAFPKNPLETIQNYVRYFFSCEECRVHFLMFKFNSSEDAVYQLWRAHNEVNARLAATKEGADPFVPKRQFPDLAMCSTCHTSSGDFNEGEVVKYLRQWYEWDPGAIAMRADGETDDLFFSPLVNEKTATADDDLYNEKIRYDPIPLHVFLTVFVIVTAMSAGVFRVRRKTMSPGPSYRHRLRT